MATNWSFARIWNASLENFQERKLEPRNYIYASEIGGSFIDRFYKMQAKPFSNPPNPRSRRKFQAGNIWEWIVKFVLMRAGVLNYSQERVKFELDGMLAVSGRLDFVAGGKIDYERALSDIRAMELPEYIEYVTQEVVKNLKETYGDKELERFIFEAKSVSTFVFERNERVNKATPHHLLQTYHYLLGKKMKLGRIVYVCKDDCRLLEFIQKNPDKEINQLYIDDIRQMTEYYEANEEPPKESELLFDTSSFRFSTNWKVEYSNYLSILYGYKDPEHYRETWNKQVGQFNRVFKRIVTNQNMTKANIEIIKEAKMYFPEFDIMVADAKKAGAFQDETDENDE